MTIPPLRYLDIAQVEQNGEPMICLSDPEGFVVAQALLSPMAFFIATQFNGENDVPEIQAAFREATGRELPEANIRDVAEFLDEQGFLLSERYMAVREQMLDAFANSPVREAHLAGSAYPDNPEELRLFIDGFFARDGGPGIIPDLQKADGDPLPGLIVPHIDYHRGGHSYAHGYLRMAQRRAPKTVIVFGVAHHAPPVPFVLSRKDFETPLGAIANDLHVTDRLAAACKYDPFEHEIVHRTEHSIEFHAVMLAYLYGADVTIVPILCGSFGVDDVQVAEQVDRFLEECRAIVDESHGDVVVIAGADLAHVGKRFGDEFDITGAIVQAVEDRDQEDLAYAITLDANGWYESVMKDQNERRVCGLNCIYATLRALESRAKQGELLHYGYAPDPAGGIVSFAGVAFS